MASTSGPALWWNSFLVPTLRRPNGPAATTVGSSSASSRGETASPVSCTPGSKSTTTSPAAASMPAFTAAAKPRGGSSVITRRRSAARLASQPAICWSPELSTMTASKSAFVCVNTDSSQRSASARHPCTTVSKVTARAAGLGSAPGGAAMACSSLPVGLSTTSHPPSRRRSRKASAAAKSRSRRRITRSSRSLSASALSVLFGFDRGGEGRQDLQRVAHDTEVGHLHDRRLGILVDRDDDLGRLHADCVLHGTRYADGDVDARPDRLARLPDLHGVRHPARVDHRAAGPHGATQGAREVLEERKVLRTAHAAAAADHHAGVFELDLLGSFDDALGDVRALRPIGHGDVERLHLSGSARLCRLE